MKKVVVLVLALLALTVVPMMGVGAQAGTIVEVAAGNPDFSTLVELVTAAGLVDTLNGEGPFTVFAPSEEAFKALPKATLDAVLADKELLKSVLLYHVAPGKIMAKDAVAANGKSVGTALKGAKIDVKVKDGKVMIDGATVIKTDIAASNGVIHVIDKVIVPSDAEIKASKAKVEPAPKPEAKSSCGGCAGK